MIVSRDLRELPTPARGGAVCSIGVFDGLHLGHRAILEANLEWSERIQARSTVVTFARHPKRVLLGRAPRTLTSLEHRLELFRRAGIAHTLVLSFDEELRRMAASDFTDEVLRRGLDTRKFVLGFDSKFGRDREGTPEFLVARGLDVLVVPKVVVGERAVSSTAIREAVELGDLAGAARMLGRPIAVYGDVVRGDGLGRQLGFPTANLDLHHELHPPPGVYACRVTRLRAPEGPEGPLPAIANIGYRPTVTGDSGDGPEGPRVEVHLLDFSGDLYGGSLEMEFVTLLREEVRFPGVEALKTQIGRDIVRAREVLTRNSV